VTPVTAALLQGAAGYVIDLFRRILCMCCGGVLVTCSAVCVSLSFSAGFELLDLQPPVCIYEPVVTGCSGDHAIVIMLPFQAQQQSHWPRAPGQKRDEAVLHSVR
jgi:hypothetical protein